MKREELHKLRKMRLTENVECMERQPYRIFNSVSEGKKPVGRRVCILWDNIINLFLVYASRS